MIELRDATFAYEDRVVLRDLNLQLRERRIGVVGSNGSGKSTFARLLNGLLAPSRGQVLVDGLDTRREGKKVRRLVGFVFQNPDSQIVFPIVEEDLAFGLKPLGLSPAERERRIADILARYGLGEFRQHGAHQLSGGQKQLLAISGVLVTEPRYIVFDEPTTLLDLRNRNRVKAAMEALPQSIVTVSHDLPLLRDYDRVLVFDGGRLVIDDAPSPALEQYVERMS